MIELYITGGLAALILIGFMVNLFKEATILGVVASIGYAIYCVLKYVNMV